MDDRGENNVSGISNRFLTNDVARRFDQDQVDRGGCVVVSVAAASTSIVDSDDKGATQ
ncbi:MAG: hypothetical protein IH918_05890 [Acidobacteria bacterium]|nr:hypothetical protein [Acidobacteriota bacterium]